MEKFKELFPVVFIIIAVVIVWQIVMINSNIRESINILSQTEKKLDSASQEIKDSRRLVDSLQLDFARFGSYLNDLQGRVEMNDLQNKLRQSQFAGKRDSLENRLAQLRFKVNLTGHDLPEIRIFDSKSDTTRYENE